VEELVLSSLVATLQLLPLLHWVTIVLIAGGGGCAGGVGEAIEVRGRDKVGAKTRQVLLLVLAWGSVAASVSFPATTTTEVCTFFSTSSISL
jgi:hypothetical protein